MYFCLLCYATSSQFPWTWWSGKSAICRSRSPRWCWSSFRKGFSLTPSSLWVKRNPKPPMEVYHCFLFNCLQYFYSILTTGSFLLCTPWSIDIMEHHPPIKHLLKLPLQSPVSPRQPLSRLYNTASEASGTTKMQSFFVTLFFTGLFASLHNATLERVS